MPTILEQATAAASSGDFTPPGGAVSRELFLLLKALGDASLGAPTVKSSSVRVSSTDPFTFTARPSKLVIRAGSVTLTPVTGSPVVIDTTVAAHETGLMDSTHWVNAVGSADCDIVIETY